MLNRKSVFKLTGFLVTFCFMISNVFAGTVFMTPGARATGMGGAFVAIADDATAIYWNPAGLKNQQGSGVEFSSFYINDTARSNKPLGNSSSLIPKQNEFIIGKLSSIEPDAFSNRDFKTSAFLPFIGAYKRLDDATVIGFGAYAAGGGGGKWEDTVSLPSNPYNFTDMYAKADGQYGFMLFNVSGARTLTEKLSFGLGVNVIYMQDNGAVQKDYLISGTPVSGIKIDANATGTGVEGVAGLLYTPIDALNLGLTFKSGSNLVLDGHATLSTIGSSDVKSNYTENYKYPMTVSFGAAYDVNEKLKVACEADCYDYSSCKKDVNYNNQVSGVFVNENVNSNWHNTITYSAGAQYKYTDNLSFMAGYQYDNGPSPQDKLTLMGTDQYSYDTLCLGVEYIYGKFKIDFSVADNISQDLSSDGISYTYNSIAYRTGVGYSF